MNEKRNAKENSSQISVKYTRTGTLLPINRRVIATKIDMIVLPGLNGRHDNVYTANAVTASRT